MKNKTISELIKRMIDANIITAKTMNGAKQTVHYWIRSGKLTPRQRPHSGYYLFNDNEIADIIKEFSEGGIGSWSFSDSKKIENQL